MAVDRVRYGCLFFNLPIEVDWSVDQSYPLAYYCCIGQIIVQNQTFPSTICKMGKKKTCLKSWHKCDNLELMKAFAGRQRNAGVVHRWNMWSNQTRGIASTCGGQVQTANTQLLCASLVPVFSLLHLGSKCALCLQPSDWNRNKPCCTYYYISSQIWADKLWHHFIKTPLELWE